MLTHEHATQNPQKKVCARAYIHIYTHFYHNVLEDHKAVPIY